MSEVHVIVCAPADWDDPGIPGSVKAQGACGHDLWIAPSGINMILNQAIETRVICIRCLDNKDREALARGPHEVPGAREELNETIGEQETDDLYRRLGIKKLGE